MHLEGADPLAPDLSDLERWYERGLRSVGIVWSRANAFAEGVPFRFPSSPDTGPGLTDAGRKLVHACNRLGILVDLSHLNEAGFWDVASLALAPLVATHSNAHALCASSRNLTDDQLDAIGKSGGVVGINFGVGFPARRRRHTTRRRRSTAIVRHVEYIASRIGVEHVAFGSDFEGATMPDELGGAAGLPRLVELLRTRFGDEDVAKITHGNWLRVLDQTWRPWGRYFAAAGDEPRPTLLDAVARFSVARPGRRSRLRRRPRHGGAAAPRLAGGRDRPRAGGARPAACARRPRFGAARDAAGAVRGGDLACVRSRQRELRASLLPARVVPGAVAADRRVVAARRPVLRAALRRARRLGGLGCGRAHARGARPSCLPRSRWSGSTCSTTRGRLSSARASTGTSTTS